MTPYISFVVTSRNDNHGEGMKKRMLLFMNGLIHQCRKHNLPAELIMVEWNPPGDTPLLHEVLPKPEKDDPLRIRYIIVPEEIHAQYKRGKEIPLFQMTAKNVGIQRAKGKFICCTNVDLLFPDEMFEILAKQDLDPQNYYRANRCDVPDQIELDWDFEKQIDFCKKNYFKRLGKDPRYYNLFKMPEKVYRYPWLAKTLNALYGIRRRWKNDPITIKYINMDSMACGDFTMMSKEAWIDLQGYIELDMYSIHIDTLALIGAQSLGYKQFIFPSEACAYHIDHESGWESTGIIERIKFSERRPGIGFDLVYDAAYLMLKERHHFNLNPKTWGFSDRDLKEIEV